jgi:hypothetical protein
VEGLVYHQALVGWRSAWVGEHKAADVMPGVWSIVSVAVGGESDFGVRMVVRLQVQSSAASGGDIDSALRSRVLAESGLCLGFMVFDGEGVKADRSEAVKYFRLAATAGCKEAEQVLGWMYNTGQF